MDLGTGEEKNPFAGVRIPSHKLENVIIIGCLRQGRFGAGCSTRRVQCGRRAQRQSRLLPATQERKGPLYMATKRFLDSKGFKSSMNAMGRSSFDRPISSCTILSIPNLCSCS